MLYLRFTMAAPIQSWGLPSPWDVKQTSLIPSKSGIVGMLSACFGFRRGDARIQELSDSLQIAVRADRPGSLMEDFQVVKSDKPYMVAANGKKRIGSGSSHPTGITIHKQYLQDARFTVFLGGTKEVLQSVYEAIKKPRFLPYFGRKCCVPSGPITPEWLEAKNIYEAVRNMNDADKELNTENESAVRMLVEVEAGGNPKTTLAQRTYTRWDRPVTGCDRNYAERRVTSYYIDL